MLPMGRNPILLKASFFSEEGHCAEKQAGSHKRFSLVLMVESVTLHKSIHAQDVFPWLLYAF